MINSPDILDVTVVIPVKNEEQNLGRCLERLKRFANIVVIDSASTDRTIEIAIAAGAKVLQFRWDGRYPKKRNWFLMNHAPSTPWVLFLDADELVDNKFCDELVASVCTAIVDGFWLNYSNYFLGKRLRYGLQQRKLALIRVGRALYEQIDEDGWSRLDMEVHEHPIVDGNIGEIRRQIEHNDFRGIERFVERHIQYARWEAHRFIDFNASSLRRLERLTGRQRFKYRRLQRWWYPWFYFLYTYIYKFGIGDGRPGFYYAFYKLWYFQTVRLLIREIISTKTTK